MDSNTTGRIAECSFFRFIRPFLFDTSTFGERSRAIAAPAMDGRLRWGDTKYFPTDELLPHVADYLNPDKGELAAAHCWDMEQSAFRQWAGFNAKWTLHFPRSGSEGVVPFAFAQEGVQLLLFRVGVGLLILNIDIQSEALEDVHDFLHYFRFANGQRGVYVKGERTIPPEHAAKAQGFSFEGTINERLEAVFDELRLPHDKQAWHEDVFIHGQLMPYTGVFIDGVPDNEIPTVLYRVRNFFHSAQELSPSAEDLDLSHPFLLSYANGQWFMFSLEGAAFVACNPPRTIFFEETLPAHLREQYFLIYLLALHQRFALMRLSNLASKHWLSGSLKARARAFESLQDAMLEFTGCGYFTQIMQREHHHRCYSKWQEVFQIDKLYAEVSAEVQAMHQRLLMIRSERLQAWVTWLGLFIGIPGLLIGFLGVNMPGITTTGEDGIPWQLAAAFGFGGGFGVALLLLLLVGWLTRR